MNLLLITQPFFYINSSISQAAFSSRHGKGVPHRLELSMQLSNTWGFRKVIILSVAYYLQIIPRHQYSKGVKCHLENNEYPRSCEKAFLASYQNLPTSNLFPQQKKAEDDEEAILYQRQSHASIKDHQVGYHLSGSHPSFCIQAEKHVRNLPYGPIAISNNKYK
ncbi:Uncharacterized protein TCM_005942 [Theobroma cacao]|uniref:Uncharacterized protein n=1 Tax=Theobroma cacao TaxID=3641 RepID=A0A061DVF5_THECC|nr:Uncharacterized protein TCM_005942 [Theobroma cacao]